MAERSMGTRRKVGVWLTLVGLLTGMLAILSPVAGADPITPGSTVGGFEIDGVTIQDKDDNDVFVSAANFALDGTGTIDWATVPSLASYLRFDDPFLPGDDGKDLGFEGGDKEFQPGGWSCEENTGSNPPKDDIHWVLAYPSLSVTNSTVAFAYYRAKAEGNTNVVIELNRKSLDSCNAAAGRSVGDLILHFDFPGGDEPADLEAYVWNGSSMVSFDVPAGVAFAATNRSDLTAPAGIQSQLTAEGLTHTIKARTFGEAAIDLVKLRDALANDPDIGDEIDPDILECPGIGFASIRTRSSGSSDQSQLHDNFPQIPMDLSDCASFKVKKVDDLGEPMAGIQFGLFDSEEDAEAGTPLAQLPTDPAQDLICTTDAQGVCTFPKVPPGTYWVNELNLPDGYTPDPDLPAQVELSTFEDEDWTDTEAEWFVNTLKTGTVVITKQVVDGDGDPITPTDITYLDGITFELQDGGETVQKRGGGDATCTLDLDDPADDPSCTITDVPFGTYDVVEDATTLPAGLAVGPSPQVTVDEESPATAEVTYENPADPLNVSIDKTGPDTANVGDTITYTFTVGLGDLPFSTVDDVDLQPLTAVQVSEVTSGTDFADRCTASPLTNTDKEDLGPLGDDWLEEGERWTYQCTHVVTATDATDSDGTALKNRAKVTGKDRYDRTDEDTDDHIVTILLPDLQVVKLAADGVDAGTADSDDETIDAPGTATYKVTVTNVGQGIARNATLTDTLPAGSWTVTLASPDGNDVCPVGGNPTSGSFTCTFGDLAPGASKSVTVSRSVTIGEDCADTLTNGVAVATTYGGVDIDPNAANDTSSADITVRCPDVGVTKSATTSPVSAGERASWTITVVNFGAGSAADVHLVDPLPSGLTDLQISGPDAADCAIEAGTLECDFGTLSPNDGEEGGDDTRVVTVSGLTDPADCGTLPNTATLADAQGAAYIDSNPSNNQDSDPVQVLCPDLKITKVADLPSTVSAGDPVGFTITVTNDGPGTAFGATLSDPLPSGDGISWTIESQTGGAACAITGSAPAQTLTCGPKDLGDDASFSVHVVSDTDPTGEVCSAATLVNTGTADATNDDPVTATASVVIQCPDLQITKVADAATVTAGDEVGFTITVTNKGPGTAYGVTIDDPLPAGDGVSWSVSPPVEGCGVTGAPGSQTLSCDVGTLEDEDSFSVHVSSDTDPTGTECVGGTLPNTATADADNDAPVEASATITVQCPNVVITKVADATSVSAGQPIGFTITVTNQGPGIARGVVLDDPLPDGVEWSIAGQSGGASCGISGDGDDQELDCGPLDLASGGSFSVHVTAPTTELDCALYENTATADPTNDGPVSATDDTLVKCPGLNITKDADDPETVTAGDQVGFVITVSNEPGDDVGTALGVTLDDPLPSGDGIDWSIESQSGGAGCSIDLVEGVQVLSCGPVDLDPGESFSVHVVSDTDPSDVECVAATLPNTATADGTNTPEKTASDTITIQCPDLSITKVADDDLVDAGDLIGFTVTVSNAGPGIARDVMITDPLPSSPGVTWAVSPAIEGDPCGISLGVLVCNVGDLGASESFSVHVQATTPGELGDPDLVGACKVYDNTATATLSNDSGGSASDSTEVLCPLDITIVKDGDDLAHRGDTVTYTFDVTNSGAADLVEVVLTDPICDDGTLTLVDDADGDTVLAIGETWAYECTRVIREDDPDPVPNTATVVGTDVRGRTTDDTDDHLVDLIDPAIDIVKTVDDETPDVGQTVTFTYVVTNTGDTTLFDVDVTDDQLGPIGELESLEPGESATLTKTMLVAEDSPTRNIATAEGEDELGKSVTDDDDAIITIVLGEVLQPTELPRTGWNPDLVLQVAGLLLIVGGALLFSSRPRRREG